MMCYVIFGLVVLISPVLVFFCIRCGTYAFFKARQQFYEELKHGKG